MFLQRYNPWGKTKRDQLQSWNILTFDPQKTNVDEHIDLINTLGDMLGWTAESKMEKFVDTMPTIIQTHLITCKIWEKTTKKANELEHIIRKCDPCTAALPNLTQDTTVPSLYSHVAHSNDKEETDIPQPFQGARPKQTKTRGGGKGKQPQQKPKPPPVQVQEEQYTYEDTNNYYHNENYRGQSRGHRPYRGQNKGQFFEVKILMVEANALKTHTKANIRVTIIKVIITKAIVVYITTHIETISKVTIMANLEAESVVMAEVITTDVVMAGLIIETITTINTISIMVMMMITSLINMAHHVHYVVVIIIPPNIVLRESMILMI